MIDTGNTNFTLSVYDQEGQNSSKQYAPARWSFTVEMAYIPTDNNDYNDLEELGVTVTIDDLDSFSQEFDYTDD